MRWILFARKLPSGNLIFLFLLAPLFILWEVECGAFVDNRLCGTLYSGSNFDGDAFILKDFDQSVNTKKDYRSSIEGWDNTRSVRVEEHCSMTMCEGTYFQGNCRSLGSAQEVTQMTPAMSVSCTCPKNSTCEDVIIPRSAITGGRAYIGKGCDSDDGTYIQLRYLKTWRNFPSEQRDDVRRIVIRNGCNLTIYSKPNRRGSSTVITTPIVRDFQGRIGSYEFGCDDSTFVPPPRPASYPPRISLPTSESQLSGILSSNKSMLNHPGVNAALKSAARGRSSRNAYIHVIGGISTSFVDVWNCDTVGFDKIRECWVSVNLDEMGIKNAQIRVIHALIAFDNAVEDARWIASLDDYLSNHEELSEAIPNAVVIFHERMTDNTVADKGSKFQRKLAAVDTLRWRLLDENYSNLVLLLHSLKSLPSQRLRRNPSKRIEKFENAIEISDWTFPKPLFLVARTRHSLDQPKMYGNWKLSDLEYWPNNFQEKLLLLTEKGGDPLGHAIFEAAFPGEEKQVTVTLSNKRGELLEINNSKIQLYRQGSHNESALQSISDSFKRKLEQRKFLIADKISSLEVHQRLKNLENRVDELERKLAVERGQGLTTPRES